MLNTPINAHVNWPISLRHWLMTMGFCDSMRVLRLSLGKMNDLYPYLSKHIIWTTVK